MSTKTQNQKAWWLVLPVVLLVAFNAVIPLMAVVNYSVQETFGNNEFFFEGVRWFQQVMQSRALPRGAAAADPVHGHRARDPGAARGGHRAGHAAQGHRACRSAWC